MPLPDGTIYADHAATTPMHPDVLAAMLPYFSERFGNPSSVHRLGRQALNALDSAHETVAKQLGCRPTEVVFTGGGSEADNLAIKGVAYAQKRRGNHIITSSVEHHAVLHTCQQLEKEGYRVTYLPVDAAGRVSPADVAAAITDETALVTLMYANNEVGTVQPVAEIGRLCRERKVPFHTDAVQANLLDLDVAALQVDLLTLSAHKFYGPKGVGILYVRQGTRIQPQTLGGSQERNRRAGTENIPGAVGAAVALERIRAGREAEAARLQALQDTLATALLAIPGARLTGHPAERVPGSVSLTFPGVEGESLLIGLDDRGICASAGSACSSGEIEPSHVLTAMGLTAGDSRGHLRLTLGETTTEADVAAIATAVPQVLESLRALATR
ncbi:MAG TPA: cysteine desulfurase family protein [Ktedonobacterales bacterium]